MSEQWDQLTLADACEIRPPKRESLALLAKGDLVSFVSMEELPTNQMFLAASRTKPLEEVYKGYTYFADGDVLMAKITPCFQNGKLAVAEGLTNGVGFGSSEFVVFRPNECLDSGYLFHFLSQQSFREEGVARMSGAVGHQRVPKEFIEDYKLPIPPLREQRRIVSVLDEAFGAIAKAKENAERNLANAKELFDSYLNNFFSSPPSSWANTTVGDVVELHGGSQPPKSTFIKESRADYVRLVQIRDYKSDKHAVYIPLEKARRFCETDDVMIGRYGPPLFQILRGIQGAYNVALMKAVPDEERLSKEFLFYFLQNRDLFVHIERSSSRTAGQTGFKKETLQEFPISFPTRLAEQTRAVQKLQTIETQSGELRLLFQRKIEFLDELKQSILRKAFTGELTANSPELESIP